MTLCKLSEHYIVNLYLLLNYLPVSTLRWSSC